MKRIFISLVLFALLGLIASVLMTRLHYQIAKTGFQEKSFCNVSEFVDCDTALASRYSRFETRFGVIPTSELGILYYLLLGGGVLYAWFSATRRAALSFLFGASLFAFGYSLVMATLSVFKLGVICLLCLTTYLCNLFILILLPRAMEVSWRGIMKFIETMRPRLLPHLLASLLFFFFGLLFFRGLNPQVHKVQARVPPELYLKAFYSLPQKEFVLPERPMWGNPKGSVKIVEFSDFQCPFCRRAAFTLKPFLKEFRNEVQFVAMNYPLDNTCNPAVTQAMHPVACLAAKAALCAFREGKFWDYHDRVFENQKRLSRATLLKIAGETGMDQTAFEKCMVSDETAALLKEDVDLGALLEVRGTPAVYINGRPFNDWSQPERLRMVIEAERNRQASD